MQDDFTSLFDYNRWADRLVLEACRKLTPKQYAAEPAPGLSSVRATLVHLAITTEGWLRGLTGQEITSVPTEAELPTLDDAAALLDRAYATVDGLLTTMTPEWADRPMVLRGGSRSAVLPPWVVMRHVVNHATYHRGQIASKLARLGIQSPATDLVFWAMERFPQSTTGSGTAMA